MNTIITAFRTELQKLIDDEQQMRGIDTARMIAFLQSHVSLPEFYRVPAQKIAARIGAEHADGFPENSLQAALQEAIKAVYGAWIREHFREV